MDLQKTDSNFLFKKTSLLGSCRLKQPCISNFDELSLYSHSEWQTLRQEEAACSRSAKWVKGCRAGVLDGERTALYTMNCDSINVWAFCAVLASKEKNAFIM